MALKVELLIEATQKGRAALAALNDGKRFTAIDLAGQSTSLVGQFGADYFEEGQETSLGLIEVKGDPQLRAHAEKLVKDTENNSEAQAAGKLLAEAESVAGRLDETRAAEAGGFADPAAISPILLLLLQAALKRLMDKLIGG